MSLWNLPDPPLEPPEDEPVGYCVCCGGEIYEGETVYDTDDGMIHEDCLADFAAKYFADCRKEAENYAEAYH